MRSASPPPAAVAPKDLHAKDEAHEGSQEGKSVCSASSGGDSQSPLLPSQPPKYVPSAMPKGGSEQSLDARLSMTMDTLDGRLGMMPSQPNTPPHEPVAPPKAPPEPPLSPETRHLAMRLEKIEQTLRTARFEESFPPASRTYHGGPDRPSMPPPRASPCRSTGYDAPSASSSSFAPPPPLAHLTFDLPSGSLAPPSSMPAFSLAGAFAASGASPPADVVPADPMLAADPYTAPTPHEKPTRYRAKPEAAAAARAEFGLTGLNEAEKLSELCALDPSLSTSEVRKALLAAQGDVTSAAIMIADNNNLSIESLMRVLRQRSSGSTLDML